jgi:hypothetical protein
MHEEHEKTIHDYQKSTLQNVDAYRRHGIEYTSMPGVTRKPPPATSNRDMHPRCMDDQTNGREGSEYTH